MDLRASDEDPYQSESENENETPAIPDHDSRVRQGAAAGLNLGLPIIKPGVAL